MDYDQTFEDHTEQANKELEELGKMLSATNIHDKNRLEAIISRIENLQEAYSILGDLSIEQESES